MYSYFIIFNYEHSTRIAMSTPSYQPKQNVVITLICAIRLFSVRLIYRSLRFLLGTYFEQQ
jgi:hypothetical protein